MADNVAGQTASQSSDQLTTGSSQGKVVYDATAIVAADSTRVQVGFKPRYVRWENATDRVMIEWFEGMADDSALLTVAAGTRTLVTSSGVTPSASGFTIKAATLVASKTFAYEAIG